MERVNTISNAEMKVMNEIWNRQDEATIQEMVTALNEQGEEWAYQTVATFLRRLEAKGVLSSNKKSNKLSYFPLLSREQYERREARGFIERNFRGSLRDFLAAYSGEQMLSEGEKKEVQDWLNELGK